MNSNDITLQRLGDLLVIVELALDSIRSVMRDAETGNISPREAADVINEAVANITASNSPSAP